MAATKKKKAAKAKEVVGAAVQMTRQQIEARLQDLLGDGWREDLERKEFYHLAHAREKEAEARRLADELEAVEVREQQVSMVPDADASTDAMTSMTLLVNDVVVIDNHREDDSDADLERLARSMSLIGLQQPIGVREDHGPKGKRFELIWGSRRLRAAKKLGWSTIDAMVYSPETTESEIEIRRAAENINRREISPSEQALAVVKMVEAVAADTSVEMTRLVIAAGDAEQYVAQVLGRPVSWVRDLRYITKLGGYARDLLRQRRIDLGHARVLALLGDPDVADDWAGTASRSEDGTGGMSVHALRAKVEEQLANLSRARWSLDVPFEQLKKHGLPAGACSLCEFNSGVNPGLFGLAEAEKSGRCSHPACFKARSEIAEEEIAAGLKKVAAAQAKAEKKGTKVSVAEFIPVTVKASTFKRAAEAVLKGEKSADEAAGGKPKSTYDYYGTPKTPEQKAAEDHRFQTARWKERAGQAVSKALQEIPCGILAWQVVEEQLSEVYGYYQHGSAEEAAQARSDAFARFVAGQAHHLLDLLAKPTIKGLQENMPAGSKYVGFSDLLPEAVLAIAAKLEVEIPPPPAPGEVVPGYEPSTADDLDDDGEDGGDGE